MGRKREVRALKERIWMPIAARWDEDERMTRGGRCAPKTLVPSQLPLGRTWRHEKMSRKKLTKRVSLLQYRKGGAGAGIVTFNFEDKSWFAFCKHFWWQILICILQTLLMTKAMTKFWWKMKKQLLMSNPFAYGCSKQTLDGRIVAEHIFVDGV